MYMYSWYVGINRKQFYEILDENPTKNIKYSSHIRQTKYVPKRNKEGGNEIRPKLRG